MGSWEKKKKPLLLSALALFHATRPLRQHGCQVSSGFSDQISIKISTISKKFEYIWKFKHFTEELNWFFVKTSAKKARKSYRQHYQAPFLPLLAKNVGHTAFNISRPNYILYGPFWVILKIFQPPGNSVRHWRIACKDDARRGGVGAGGAKKYVAVIWKHRNKTFAVPN